MSWFSVCVHRLLVVYNCVFVLGRQCVVDDWPSIDHCFSIFQYSSPVFSELQCCWVLSSALIPGQQARVECCWVLSSALIPGQQARNKLSGFRLIRFVCKHGCFCMSICLILWGLFFFGAQMCMCACVATQTRVVVCIGLWGCSSGICWIVAVCGRGGHGLVAGYGFIVGLWARRCNIVVASLSTTCTRQQFCLHSNVFAFTNSETVFIMPVLLLLLLMVYCVHIGEFFAV